MGVPYVLPMVVAYTECSVVIIHKQIIAADLIRYVLYHSSVSYVSVNM